MSSLSSQPSDRPLRIAHTESSCGWGGQEIRILEEMRGFVERGHSVELIAPPQATLTARAKTAGLVVHELPIARKRVEGVIALRNWIRRHGVDVINTHSSTDSWLTALARLTLRAAPPVVRTRHISAPIPESITSRWLYRHATQHVVTTGARLRDVLVEQLQLPLQRVTSVPTGIDPVRFSPGDKKDARRRLGLHEDATLVGIVATLRSWKGHMVLLDAMTRLDESIQLIIVGDGPMRDALHDAIRRMGLSARVSMVGEQLRPEDWFRALDVFCLPSYANEGVPQALMQAMLCGLPVVSTPIGAILEAVSNEYTGLIVPAQDAPALSIAIQRIVTDRDLAGRLGQAARKDALDRFGFDRMVNGMESIFRAVATSHR